MGRTSKLNYLKLTTKNRIARAVWTLVWTFLYRPSPRIFHFWRRFLLRVFGAQIGIGVRPYPASRVWAPWNLKMGDYSCLSDYVDCYSVDKIDIGMHSTVSQYSFICTASHDYFKSTMPLITAPIIIGNYAWITADVFIGPGVIIGDGAVIIARSSVFDNIPSWQVARGNPAVVTNPRRFIR